MERTQPEGTQGTTQEPEGQKFRLVAQTEAEEQAYNYVQYRNTPKPSGLVGSVAHIVKGALGAGILSGHVAYKKAGVFVAIPMNICFGIYMGYCLYLLVKSAQVLYRRTRVPTMTYPDVGEAACACHSNPKIVKFAKHFRHLIDTMICMDLFGSCASYQIIIAKSIKQLVENTEHTSMEGIKVFCIGVAIAYAFQNNPKFEGMTPYTSLYSFLQFVGMNVFSMSCVSVVVPIENNMKDPTKFGLAITVGMGLVILSTFSVSFFGYAAFLENSESPITVNFALNTLGKVVKGSIIVMIYITHGLNFWVPFMTVFHYIKKRHDPNKEFMWEMIYRTIFVIAIAIIAIIFPTINALIGFLGAFCISSLGFIFPPIIYFLVIWDRPGLGRFKWRLYFGSILIIVGVFFSVCGSTVNIIELVSIAINPTRRVSLEF
ncbi:unnamed protein product [Parnassius apollo]|uniref:(apollo) hypothetical protein n=1 Tax=Parnassius apollo TaxID=110799 RepID=A0A8S3X1A8_PARAO|nr:unnamed protein product [Parnassius apollo]